MNLNGHIAEDSQTALRVIKADQVALDAHWPWLREQLFHVKRANDFPNLGDRRRGGEPAVGGRCRWIPEQIRFLIMQGFYGKSAIELFFIVGPDFEERDDQIKGWLVTTCRPDDFFQVPLDFVLWLGGGENFSNIIDECRPQIIALARMRGCTAIEHQSPRPGWIRRHRHWGFQLKYFQWRLELI